MVAKSPRPSTPFSGKAERFLPETRDSESSGRSGFGSQARIACSGAQRADYWLRCSHFQPHGWLLVDKLSTERASGQARQRSCCGLGITP